MLLTEPKDAVGYRFFRDWIGDSLLVSIGKKWNRNRRLLTKAFHFEYLQGYTKTFNACAEILLKKWEKTATDKKILEISNDITLLTFDIILRCAMSCESNCQKEGTLNEYVNAVLTLTQTIVKRIYNPFIHSDFIFYLTPIGRKYKACCDYIHRFDEKIISQRKYAIREMLEKIDKKSCKDNDEDVLQLRQQSCKAFDFLDILLLTRDEDGKGLSDREIRDEVDAFMFGGHDTTASALQWMFYCLARYPEHQEKCREEILDLVDQKDIIEWGDINKLNYSSMFIKEVLRLYPPVYFLGRRTVNPIYFPRGFGDDQYCLDDTAPPHSDRTIEPPANFNIAPYYLHHNSAVWDKPEEFDPLRFTSENSKNRSPHAYIPFSAGPRNCLGKNFANAEIKVILCKALQRFRFYIDADCPEPQIFPSIILKAKDGIYLKIEAL